MNWLRQRREELKLNQDELTARLQVEGVAITRASVSNWENGKHSMPLNDPEFRVRLAKAVKLSEREILQLSGYDIGQFGHTDEGERAASIVDRLPAEKKELAIKLLEAMV
jgi:transcriptional regulator with XRE-family HTH domain